MAQYGKGSLYKKNLGLVSTPTGNTPATGGTLNAMGLPYAGGEKFRPKKHAGRLTDDYGGLDYMISQYKKDDERKDINRGDSYYDPKNERGIALRIVQDHRDGRFDPNIWGGRQTEKIVEKVVEKDSEPKKLEEPTEEEVQWANDVIEGTETPEYKDEYRTIEDIAAEYGETFSGNASSNDEIQRFAREAANDYMKNYIIDLLGTRTNYRA